MKLLGVSLIVLGIFVLFAAFGMDTSVSTLGTYSEGSFIGGGSTYNLGLLQKQMMVFQTGLTALIAGAVFYGAGAIYEGQRDGSMESPAEPSKGRWDEARQEETEEQRQDRVDRVQLTHKVIGGILLTVILGFAIVLY